MYFQPGTPWTGATVAVLASGPSMSQAVADSVRHLPRIAVNTTFKLAPDADVIYAADSMWWLVHRDQVMLCPGWKVTCQARQSLHPNVPEGVMVMRWGGTVGFDDRPGYLRTGGNSGYAAIHLAASMGAKTILLYGFDASGGHWHGEHPAGSGLANPKDASYRAWIKRADGLAPELTKRGIEVVNCTPGSRLACFKPLEIAA